MERFSLIPKLDQSFSYCESDEDFEVGNSGVVC